MQSDHEMDIKQIVYGIYMVLHSFEYVPLNILYLSLGMQKVSVIFLIICKSHINWHLQIKMMISQKIQCKQKI